MSKEIKIVITHPKIKNGGIVRIFKKPKIGDITEFMIQAARILPYGNFEPNKSFRAGNYNMENTRHLYGLSFTFVKNEN